MKSSDVIKECSLPDSVLVVMVVGSMLLVDGSVLAVHVDSILVVLVDGGSGKI